MDVEILGADLTPKQVEVNEGKANFPSEMDGKSFSNLGQELNEPTKTFAKDTLNGTIGKPKEGDNLESSNISNIPKDAVDEWPAPKQIHAFYFIRIRSYENPQLKTEIAKAETDLKKKIDTRSEIIDQLKEKRTVRSKLKSELQPFLVENKIYRTALEEKRNEIKPLQENLQKHRAANNYAREKGMGLCSSQEELNDLIQSLHYRIQHESNTLNEEKQLLKEIKQLEATREKVIANISMKAEIEKSKGEKAETQEKMKLLGVNMDEVRKEKQAVMDQIKQIDEKLKDVDNEIALLEDKLRSATEKKDLAYENRNALRKRRDEVNTCFYQNRSLLNNAKELAAKKDIAGLEALSNSEVEKFMSQWSSSKAFRDDYERRILSSLNSRQLSKDGRMRNPDEKPIIVGTTPAAKLETPSLKVNPELGKEAIKLPSSEGVVSSSKSRGEELTESAKPDAGRKISNTEEIGRAHEDEPPKELSKSKEIDPTKLKEMKREEEIAKAKLAMERKKKLAEKAAAKAEARAQKEAAEKLKQKEKKAIKKAGTTEPALPAEQTEAEMKTEEPEEADVKPNNSVSEASKPQKVNVKYRNWPKAKEQLPRVILKRKKSHSYGYWAAPAAILAVLPAVVGYYYYFGGI